MQGLNTQEFLGFCIPLGRFVALLAVVSVASVGFSYLIGAVGYALTYAFVVIGALLAALLAFKNV